MKLVIDANPLFSALIKDGFAVNVIVNECFELYAPEFLFDEFLEHKKEILGKTKRSEKELNHLVDNLKEIVRIVPKNEFEPYLEEAKQLTSDIDDIFYLVLALKLNIGIWSNDKKLKKQDKVKIYSTEDLKKEFISSSRKNTLLL